MLAAPPTQATVPNNTGQVRGGEQKCSPIGVRAPKGPAPRSPGIHCRPTFALDRTADWSTSPARLMYLAGLGCYVPTYVDM